MSTTSQSSSVRIGVVGVGNFGRVHARTLHGLAEAELAGVVDPSAESIDELRRDVADVRAWTDIELALRECDAEGWVIATRADSHVPLAERVLAAGKSVLVEKPLAADVVTARRLAPLVAADSSNLMMGHIVLFASKFRRLLHEVRARGSIVHFHAVRHRPAYLERNPLHLTMVHDLYMAVALMEGEEPDHLSGHLHPRGDGGFDLALAEMHWPNGAWGSFTASFLAPPGMPADGFDRFEVFGRGWAARLELNPQPLQVWDTTSHFPMSLDIDDSATAPSGWLAEELRHFCRVVRGRAAVPLGARYADALQVQSWIERLEGAATC
jgi:predicted dehydrogenase